MNFLQIVNRVRQNCGVSGQDYPTVIGATGEQLRLVNWVNEAWMDLQAKRQDWQWMRTKITFPTVSGQPVYTQAQIGITDFGMWARDTWRNYANPIVSIVSGSPCVVNLPAHNLNAGDTIQFQTTGTLPTGLVVNTNYYVLNPQTNSFTFAATSGGTAINSTGLASTTVTITSNNTTSFCGFNSETFVEYIEYDYWRNSYKFGALREMQTRPLNITITPDKNLGLGPFPVVGYTMVGDYYRVPTELALDTDTPALPEKFHLFIVYAAMEAYGQYEAAPDVLSRAQKGMSSWLPRICADQGLEISQASSLA